MDNRDQSVNVRFTKKGIEMIDKQRDQLSRGAYIRQALAYAIKMGFQPRPEL